MKIIEPHVYHIRKEYVFLPANGKDDLIISLCGRYMYDGEIPGDEGPCDSCERIFDRDYEMCEASDEFSHKKSDKDTCGCKEKMKNE